MTDKEKLEKIKALADKMYSRMAYLTSDTRPIRQAMDEYHQFIINEYHKDEPVSEKECMYSKDNFTDEDRKALCEGCEEECKYKPTTSVWHDAKEMQPDGKRYVLCYDGKFASVAHFNEVVACKWAYVDELIKL